MSTLPSVASAAQQPQSAALESINSSCSFNFPKSYACKSYACNKHYRNEDITAYIQSVKQEGAAIEAGRNQGRCTLPIQIARAVVSLVSSLITAPLSYLPGVNCHPMVNLLNASDGAGVLRRYPAWHYKNDPSKLAALAKTPHWSKLAGQGDILTKARAILFAATDSAKTERERLFASRESQAPINCKITTPDNVELDAIFFPGTKQQAIIFAPGIGGMYEECAVDFVANKMIAFFKKQFEGAAILMVNTRGINRSTGSVTANTFSLDIFSAYQFLINEFGFDPENILSYGHSLGGAYGLQAAALIQKQYPEKKISAVLDRSIAVFSDSVGAEATAKMNCLIKPIVSLVIRHMIQISGQDLSCQSAVKQLKGGIVAIASKNDPKVIYDKASFAKAMQHQGMKNLEIIELTDDVPVDTIPICNHLREFSETEASKIQTAVNKIFKREVVGQKGEAKEEKL